MPEHHFEIETTEGVIRGMRHTPFCGNLKAVVIFVHGYFSANRVGPARLYVLLARTLSEQGYAVIRADLLGVGDSDGDFDSITFYNETRDLHTICDYAAREFIGTPIILCGHSMGANLALRVTSERKDIQRLILIAPDVYKKNGIDSLFTEEQKKDLNQHGWTLRKGLRINSSFIDEIRSNSPLEIISKISIPIVIVQGDSDELYSYEGANLLASKAYDGVLITIKDGDHNFLLPTAKRDLLTILPPLLLNSRPDSREHRTKQ